MEGLLHDRACAVRDVERVARDGPDVSGRLARRASCEGVGLEAARSGVRGRRSGGVVGDEIAQPLADAFGDRDHLFGGVGREVDPTLAAPEVEPGFEVFFFEAEREMALRHRSGVARGPAGGGRPEVGDFFEVLGPVVDLCVENRADLAVLADVCVETTQERGQSFAAADALKEGGVR